jgi:hypothetical protein
VHCAVVSLAEKWGEKLLGYSLIHGAVRSFSPIMTHLGDKIAKFSILRGK